MNDKVLLAVNGTLMRGLELENNLKEVGASFVKESQTEKAYRLFSVDDRYPAMIKDTNGASIDVEVYELTLEAMQIVLSKEELQEYLSYFYKKKSSMVKKSMA